MSLPTLSVVLPHYNHGRFLRRAVEALLKQSAPPLEIILIDDASTDGSGPLLAELAAHPRVRLHHNDRNRGVAYSTNRGLSLCRGAYVHLTAADDLALPGFYALALDMARAHPAAGLVFGKMAMTDEAGTVLRVFEASAWRTARFATPQEFLRQYLEGEATDHSLCASTIYRREALQALGGYRTDLGHWMDTFVARAVGLRHGACYVPQTFMNWRSSPGGVSGGSGWEERARVVRRAAELMRSEPFRRWFPERHVAWWERASLEGLFCARVCDRWPLLRRWNGQAGWRARVANRCIRALAWLGRRLYDRRPTQRVNR
jgi:glycosyltransferase involved in cell wall biosynthesis